MYPAWSPDGKQIAFASNPDGNSDIYIMDANGTNLTQITHNDADDLEPAWSPDGKQIAFASNPAGNYDIYVITVD